MEVLTSFILVLAVAAGNLFKFSFFSTDIRPGGVDIVAGLILGLAIFFRFGAFRKFLSHRPALTTALTVFLAWTFFSLIWAYTGYGFTAAVVSLFYFIRLTVFVFLPFALASLLRFPGLIRSVYAFGFVVVSLGALQYLIFPDIRHLQIADWDPHYYRVVGSLLDPGFMGIILILFMLFLLSHPLKNRLHHYLILGFSYLVFALTYSRSSYLALLAASVSISLIKKSWRPFFLTLLLLFFTFTFLPRSPDGEGVKLERTSSIIARIQNWKNSITIISSRPLTGVGYNAYRYAQKDAGFLEGPAWLRSHAGAGADSSLLFITATTGLIGLFLYLNYLKFLYSLQAFIPELSALVVHSIFLNSLFYPFVLYWLACLIALAFTAPGHRIPLVAGGSGSPPRR